MNNDQKIDLILQKIDAMEGRMDAMEGRMDAMGGRMDAMDGKMDKLQSDVTNIIIQIENEIVPSIKRVAEGHLDLDRHLKEATTSRTEYEMLTLRVNHLESAVEKIEKKIG